MSTEQEMILKSEVMREINTLLERKSHPEVREDIDLVWVFSGPGTYYEALKDKEPEWGRYMDRYRILYGAALVREVTAKRLNKSVHMITKDDISESGPVFFYNGIPSENSAFRRALGAPTTKIPHDIVRVEDTVVDERKHDKRPISNTLDQVKSFPPDLRSGNKRVALVSHGVHMPRILRYLSKYSVFPDDTPLEIFSLQPPKSGKREYIKEEIDRVWRYYEKGDLAYEPFGEIIE